MRQDGNAITSPEMERFGPGDSVVGERGGENGGVNPVSKVHCSRKLRSPFAVTKGLWSLEGFWYCQLELLSHFTCVGKIKVSHGQEAPHSSAVIASRHWKRKYGNLGTDYHALKICRGNSHLLPRYQGAGTMPLVCLCIHKLDICNSGDGSIISPHSINK